MIIVKTTYNTMNTCNILRKFHVLKPVCDNMQRKMRFRRNTARNAHAR